MAYHDDEWGVPVHDEHRLFELLVLEGAQAGLSWSTILAKRAAYRRAFVDFDPVRVARFTPARIAKLLGDPGIVRNRLKVESAVRNAKAFLRIQDEVGGFAALCLAVRRRAAASECLAKPAAGAGQHAPNRMP